MTRWWLVSGPCWTPWLVAVAERVHHAAVAGDHDVTTAGQRYAAWEGTYRDDPWTAVRRDSLRHHGVRLLGLHALAGLVVIVAVDFVVRLVVALVRRDPLRWSRS